MVLGASGAGSEVLSSSRIQFSRVGRSKELVHSSKRWE